MALTKEGKVPDLCDRQHTHDTRARQLVSLSFVDIRGGRLIFTHPQSIQQHSLRYCATFQLAYSFGPGESTTSALSDAQETSTLPCQ